MVLEGGTLPTERRRTERPLSPLLQIHNLWKRYNGFVALRDVSLEVCEGEIVCLLGPSGSGKSTLLRCIAGLEVPEAGAIIFDGHDITALPVHRRGFGLMFQQFALFPHRTVAENIAFGLRMQSLPRPEIEARVSEMLELVGLSGYGDRDIFELSGGEQQRVALARSLAPKPRLLMLDEPLGSLDRTLRERLMDELRQILTEIGMTAIYVTHDQQEAFAVSDRIVLLHEGEIVQVGSPEQVYRQPASQFAARFFGLTNLLPGTIVGAGRPGEPKQSPLRVATPLGELEVTCGAPLPEAAPHVLLLIRPEAARPVAETCTEPNVVHGIVVERSFRGGHYRLATRHSDGPILEWEITTPDRDFPPVGQPITLCLRSDAMSFLPPDERQTSPEGAPRSAAVRPPSSPT